MWTLANLWSSTAGSKKMFLILYWLRTIYMHNQTRNIRSFTSQSWISWFDCVHQALKSFFFVCTTPNAKKNCTSNFGVLISWCIGQNLILSLFCNLKLPITHSVEHFYNLKEKSETKHTIFKSSRFFEVMSLQRFWFQSIKLYFTTFSRKLEFERHL